MSQDVLKTRIILRHDEIDNFNNSDLELKEGELVLAKVFLTDENGLSVPTFVAKIGNNKKFSECPWLRAEASDVSEWAKKEQLDVADIPVIPQHKIQGLSDLLNTKVNKPYSYQPGNIVLFGQDGSIVDSNVSSINTNTSNEIAIVIGPKTSASSPDGVLKRMNVSSRASRSAIAKYTEYASLKCKMPEDNNITYTNDTDSDVMNRRATALEDEIVIDKARTYTDSMFTSVQPLIKGACKAVVYDSYVEMVEQVNLMSNEELFVGQNILIRTLEVPDLWVYSIESDPVDYTYVSEEDFLSSLREEPVQIGYYCVSALETQKVNLSDYVVKPENALANNLAIFGHDGSIIDSGLSIPVNNTSAMRVIISQPVNQGLYYKNLANKPQSGAVPVFNTNGSLKSNTPTDISDVDVVNRIMMTEQINALTQYFDTTLSSRIDDLNAELTQKFNEVYSSISSALNELKSYIDSLHPENTQQ